jgi:predicted dehydrogenase
MNIVVIGCGNIGTKRIQVIQKDNNSRILALIEKDSQRSIFLKNNYSYPLFNDYSSFLNDPNVNAFIVSAPPYESYKIITDCLNAGKHVLCEKPLGKSLSQTQSITEIANKNNLILKCGFNLRHDTGLITAHQWLDKGLIGKPYFFKCTYVNGTVLVNSNRVGSLLDMGIHIIDLARWFMGDLNEVKSLLNRFEYSQEELDDNGFVIFKSNSGIGTMHFSFIRWMNSFSLEITGEKGIIEVQNLPKWGKQYVINYKREYPSGVPQKESFTYEGDNSWHNEWVEFCRCVKLNDKKWNNDGLQAMQIADRIKNCNQ